MALREKIQRRIQKVALEKVDLRTVFPSWSASSAGDKNLIQDELISSINMFAPFIAENLTKTRIWSTEEFIQMHRKVNDQVLGNLFDLHGSDKTRLHHYHSIYAPIIAEIKNPRKMLEIGLGTNNTSVLSNMGIDGTPGASLRAFRDYMPNCICLGADIDEGILFEEERIRTYPLDQTKIESFDALRKATGAILT